MEVVEGLDNTAGVEPGGGVVKVSTISEDGPQLSSQAGLHQHVEVLPVFECLEQFDNEMAVRFFHNFFL